MTINISMPDITELKPQISVIGVGGAGGNAVNNMIHAQLEGVEFIVANTDAQSLAASLTDRRVQLGVTLTQGLGAGSRPDVGRAAAEEVMEVLAEHLQGSHMVFITAGMGGGTGTGAGPVIAQIAREAGALTVGVVTKPFQFEGAHRMVIAEAGIEELQHHVDTLIIIPNQNLFRVANEKTTFAEAFKLADNVLYSGVRGVTDLMVMPGLINLDFADIRTVMMEMGKAMMGTGEAEGERRALDAAESAIANPLLDDVSMKGAKGVLINICGGPDLTLFEVDEAANRIREEVDPGANIIFGSTFEDDLEGRVRLSLVATGIDAEASMPRLRDFANKRSESGSATQPILTAYPGGRDSAAQVVQTAPTDRSVLDLPGTPTLHPIAQAAVQPIAQAAAQPITQAAVQPIAQAVAQPITQAAVQPIAQAAAQPIAQVLARPEPEASQPELPPLPGVAEEPAPAATSHRAPAGGDRPFVPPRPIAAGVQDDRRRAPEPFAEAAVANGGRVTASKASLFERMTGTGRARKYSSSGDTAHTASPPKTEAAVSSLFRPAPKAKFTRDEAMAAGKPEARVSPSSRNKEDDLLEIPAFLRRQAN